MKLNLEIKTKTNEMKHILEDFNVCPPAVDWVGDRTVEESVNECPKGEWMLWMASELNLDKRKLMLAKGLCAETVKHLMTDKRSVKSVEGAIAYGRGEIDDEELEMLKQDAIATAAYDATYATAYAAIATDAAYAAYTATYSAATYAAYAAADAAYATYAATYAAYAAIDAAEEVRKTNKKQTADICREVFGEWLIEELNKLKQSK